MYYVIPRQRNDVNFHVVCKIQFSGLTWEDVFFTMGSKIYEMSVLNENRGKEGERIGHESNVVTN